MGFWVKIGEKLEKKEKKNGIWVNKLKILGKHSRKWDKASNSGKIWVKKLVKFAGFWSKTVKNAFKKVGFGSKTGFRKKKTQNLLKIRVKNGLKNWDFDKK